MSRDSFGSFSSPLKSAHRDSFGSFQDYKVESIHGSTECSPEKGLELVVEEQQELDNIKQEKDKQVKEELSIFTDESVFFNFTSSDPVQVALKKCFTFDEMVAMASRTLMTCDEAEKLGKDVLVSLTSAESWAAIVQYTR